MIYAAIASASDCVERHLEKTIESIDEFVDKTVVFDGDWNGEQSSMDYYSHYEWINKHRISFELVLPEGRWNTQTGKRVFMSNYGGPDSWCFFLDSDEILVAGGDWIRRAPQMNPNARIFKVLVTEKGKSMWRDNMFAHGAFEHGSKDTGVLPVVIEHLGLGATHVP